MGATTSKCFPGKKEGSDSGLPNFGFRDGFKDEYTVGKELGRGQFGVTYLATRTHKHGEKEEFAAKFIKKSSLTDSVAIEDVKREVKILNTLEGKSHVVQMVDTFESKDEVILVLELCKGGELFARVLKKGKYAEKDAADIMRQILKVIADCHLNGVIHRDLKPENFLFDKPGDDAKLKLIDFGLSDFFTMDKVFHDVAGSAFYVAPEVLKKNYGPAADVWSAGVIMYILLTGAVPFWAPTEPGIFKQVLTGTLDLKNGPFAKVSTAAKQLLLTLLNRDPKGRSSAAKALVHPWIDTPGVALETPLDITVIANMDRFAGYNKLKQQVLVKVAETFTTSDLKHLRRQFIEIDKDNSGTITIDEMRKAITTFRSGQDNESVHNEDDITRMMSQIDVDGDGHIDYMEFVAASMSTYQLSHGFSRENAAAWDSRIRIVFDSIDEDGNGKIDAKELSNLLGSSPDVQELINEADKDGDGLIDYGEFQALLRETTKNKPNFQQ